MIRQRPLPPQGSVDLGLEGVTNPTLHRLCLDGADDWQAREMMKEQPKDSG
jgi:hypothetical protein